MMTTDDFFAHVQEHGFQGYTPGRGDVMGDRWAAKVGQEFDRVATDLPLDQARHTTWLVFQWLYCELAGMRSRVIASPPACRAAGLDITPAIVDQACRLLIASTEE